MRSSMLVPAAELTSQRSAPRSRANSRHGLQRGETFQWWRRALTHPALWQGRQPRGKNWVIPVFLTRWFLTRAGVIWSMWNCVLSHLLVNTTTKNLDVSAYFTASLFVSVVRGKSFCCLAVSLLAKTLGIRRRAAPGQSHNFLQA